MWVHPMGGRKRGPWEPVHEEKQRQEHGRDRPAVKVSWRGVRVRREGCDPTAVSELLGEQIMLRCGKERRLNLGACARTEGVSEGWKEGVNG